MTDKQRRNFNRKQEKRRTREIISKRNRAVACMIQSASDRIKGKTPLPLTKHQ
jgi:hypothetical protein